MCNFILSAVIGSVYIFAVKHVFPDADFGFLLFGCFMFILGVTVTMFFNNIQE